MNDTLDIFCSEYTDFNYNNDPFGGDNFIWSGKDIFEVNSYILHQEYSLPCTKVLGFVSCRVTYKIPWCRCFLMLLG